MKFRRHFIPQQIQSSITKSLPIDDIEPAKKSAIFSEEKAKAEAVIGHLEETLADLKKTIAKMEEAEEAEAFFPEEGWGEEAVAELKVTTLSLRPFHFNLLINPLARTRSKTKRQLIEGVMQYLLTFFQSLTDNACTDFAHFFSFFVYTH